MIGVLLGATSATVPRNRLVHNFTSHFPQKTRIGLPAARERPVMPRVVRDRAVRAIWEVREPFRVVRPIGPAER
jgi:hypothetical protein